MDMDLKDKVAIVTGGSEGIGRAAAASMAEEGARVVICARRKDVLETAAEELRRETGGTVLPIQADASNPSDVERVVAGAVDAFGRLDIVVNNAGTSAAGPFEAVDEEGWQADMNLKFYGAIRFAKAAIPHMKRVGGGRIINVTNLGGKQPGANSMPTSVTRAAGIALTKAMSKDMAQYNILVNTVCIGLIRSGQHERRYSGLREQDPALTMNDFYDQRSQNVPLGRFGEAREAGDVICFLASGRASYLTGTSINIDGGTSGVV
jgi:NAD(P)-dependent dehydrogenase (short-subunit alcohol dehydrogenase family)